MCSVACSSSASPSCQTATSRSCSRPARTAANAAAAGVSLAGRWLIDMTQILPDPADRFRPKVLYPQPFTGMALALRPQPPGARPHVRLITNDNQRTVQPPVPHDVAVGADTSTFGSNVDQTRASGWR